MINTTENLRREPPKGVVEAVETEEDRQHRVNTSGIYELPPRGTLIDADEEEPEIIAVIPATGWLARFENGSTETLVAFVAWDDASMRGVSGNARRINLEDSVENRPGFAGYINDKDRSNNG